MKRFFENPLSDAAAINKRTETIQDFITVPRFPFDTELFDIAEQYLSNTDQRTKLAPHENSIGKKITNLIAEDAGYKTICNGVVALLAILQALRVFIHSNSTNSASGKAFLNEMILLSNDAAFTDLPRDVLKSKLSYQEVSRYDVILRFRHRELIKQLLTAVYHLHWKPGGFGRSSVMVQHSSALGAAGGHRQLCDVQRRGGLRDAAGRGDRGPAEVQHGVLGQNGAQHLRLQHVQLPQHGQASVELDVRGLNFLVLIRHGACTHAAMSSWCGAGLQGASTECAQVCYIIASTLAATENGEICAARNWPMLCLCLRLGLSLAGRH